MIEIRRRTLWEKLARLWPPYRRRDDAAQREIPLERRRSSWANYDEYRAWRHETLKRIAKQSERERAAVNWESRESYRARKAKEHEAFTRLAKQWGREPAASVNDRRPAP